MFFNEKSATSVFFPPFLFFSLSSKRETYQFFFNEPFKSATISGDLIITITIQRDNEVN